MGELALSILLVAISSLVGSAPWIAGVAIGWLAYHRRKSRGLMLAMTAFGGLVVLQVGGSVVIVLLFPFLEDQGWSIQVARATLAGGSMLVQVGRSALIVLLAVAFSRLLRETYDATPHR